MTMIERAARAMVAAEQEYWDLPAAKWDGETLESLGLMTLARAALQAIREPDPEIVDGVMHHFADPCWPEDAARGLTAMIDAILAEGDKTP